MPGGQRAEIGSTFSHSAEDQDQDDAGDELGHDGRRQAADGDDPVDRLARVQRRDHAAQDAERHDDDERQERELERLRHGGRDQVADRALEGERGAEVAVQDVADPGRVLRQQRLVGAELVVERVDRLGRANGPSIDRPGLPGRMCVPMKIRTDRTQRVTSPSARRRAMKRAGECAPGPAARAAGPGSVLSGGQTGLVDPDVAHGRRADSGDAGARGREEVVEVARR